jgi:hypothetical protein
MEKVYGPSEKQNPGESGRKTPQIPDRAATARLFLMRSRQMDRCRRKTNLLPAGQKGGIGS